jgi:hypothetical protein
MKALSLYEPWATLIALGEKRFETRSWRTNYRGPLLICASKMSPIVPPQLIPILNRIGLTVNQWNPGRAVALVDLVDVIQMKEGQILMTETKDELRLGDFSVGRFAWKLEKVRRFKNPFPIRGRQGLFEIPDSVIEWQMGG